MAFYFQGRRCGCGIVANGDDGNFAVSVGILRRDEGTISVTFQKLHLKKPIG